MKLRNTSSELSPQEFQTRLCGLIHRWAWSTVSDVLAGVSDKSPLPGEVLDQRAAKQLFRRMSRDQEVYLRQHHEAALHTTIEAVRLAQQAEAMAWAVVTNFEQLITRQQPSLTVTEATA
jgi:hypothetical protein